MIKTDKQLKNTEKEIARFKDALKTNMPDASREAIKGMLESLSLQVDEYAALKAGDMSTVVALSAYDLPKIIIKARIARGMSQSDLAERIFVKPQQVQRWESDNYESVSAARLFEIMDVLRIKVKANALSLVRHATTHHISHFAPPSTVQRWTGMVVTQQKVSDLRSQCGQFTAQLHRSTGGPVMHVQDTTGEQGGIYMRLASVARPANLEMQSEAELMRA